MRILDNQLTGYSTVSDCIVIRQETTPINLSFTCESTLSPDIANAAELSPDLKRISGSRKQSGPSRREGEKYSMSPNGLFDTELYFIDSDSDSLQDN